MIRLLAGHKIVALSAWAGRSTGAAVQLLAMRLILRELGGEPYALYALITGMTSWFSLSDLGFGYALQNQIAKARALGRPYESLLKVALLIGLSLFVVLTLLLVISRETLMRYYLAELNAFTHEQKLLYMLVAILFGVGGGVGNIILRAWYGEEKGWLSNLVITGTWLLTYLGMQVAIHSSVRDKLLWCIVAYFAPLSIVPLTAMVIRSGATKVPSTDAKELGTLFRMASRFWGLALMSALVLNTDLFVLARLSDAEQIAEYTVVTKILGFGLTLYAMILAAVWPLSTKLAALNRWDEVIVLVKKYIAWGSLALVAATAGLCFTRTAVVHLIAGTGTNVMPSYAIIVILGAYYIIRIWTDSFSMLLQSVNDMSAFWKWVPLQAAVSIAAQYFLGSRWGVEGIALGLIISFLLTAAWVLPFRASVVYSRMKKSHC